MDIPAVDLGRKVDPGELAEWDLAEWRHLSPPTHPPFHTRKNTQTHTPSSCSGLGEEREGEGERDSDRRTEADEWGERGRERERAREQCVPGTPRSPNTTTVSPRSIQWRSNEHNRDRPKPENILYTPHVRVFFHPHLSPPNHRWRTSQGKTRNKNEQTGEERRRKERKKKKDLRTDFFPPRYFPRDSPAI